MDSMIPVALTWILAVSSGLMAGTYLAFSGFIMRSLASLGTAQAIAAMNAINEKILGSSFMPIFFGSTLVAAGLSLAGLWHWGEAGADRAFTGGLVYIVGMFVITAARNVPLNNALARVSGSGEEAARTWADYLRRWTRWNTLRTVASVVTLIICIDLLTK